jgi:hypothetical protein
LPAGQNTFRVSGVEEYVAALFKLRQSWTKEFGAKDMWYRGLVDRRYRLLPGTYRHRWCPEQDLFLRFKNLVPSFVEREPGDEWEWYYLMQHYGLPTRLLDWSESALTALFFAVSAVAAGAVPCVWVMLPDQFNQHVHRHPDKDDAVHVFAPHGRPDFAAWLPSMCRPGKAPRDIKDSRFFASNRLPVAIFPKRHNPRLVAQRGTFTVHGTDSRAIDVILKEACKSGPDPIARIDISRRRLKKIHGELRTLGVDETALFPEPASLARDLKRLYRVG